MPLQNRVDPFGLIHAVSARGTFMGNRGGCFHTEEKVLKSTHWKTRQWITCVLEFKNRRRELMGDNRYTELFFLDEVTALAAGHRPCYECRYADAKQFREALVRSGVFHYRPKASDLSDAIAGEIQSVLKGKSEREQVATADLPDGAMFTTGAAAFLKWQGQAHPWQFSGYGIPQGLPEHAVRLTPHITCQALAHGYTPQVHPSVKP
ncbi:MAG: hypothetical protein NXH88_17485 [Hyphomonas sp.]|nr:hypothetical protein [Hyphomonas sp.]